MPLSVGRPTLAFSPDGRYLAFVAWVGSHSHLYIRNMITAEIKAVPGSEDARNPFFSPDGQWLGFSAGTKLNKVSVESGAPVSLADVSSSDNGAAWGADDHIYYNRSAGDGIAKVSTSMGQVTPVAVPPSTRGYLYPELLPNGKILAGFADWSGFCVIKPDDPKSRPEMLASLSNCNYARYVTTGHLLYVTPGKLMAIRFDLKSMRIQGEPKIMLDDLRTEDSGAGQFALSRNGLLAYVPGEHASVGSFVWRDRHGNTIPVGLKKRYYGSFPISHDGRRMAYVVNDMGQRDIYVYEFGGREIRSTGSGGIKSSPIWSPDDKSVIFNSMKDGIWNSYMQSFEGSEGEIALTHSSSNAGVFFFTRDKKQMLVGWPPFFQLIPAMTPIGSTTAPAARIDLSRERDTWFLGIHRDGSYLSYSSSQYDRSEIFVQSVPSLAWKKQVSSTGGEEPHWNPNGRELIYRWGTRWYVIDAKLQPKPDFAVPRELFVGPYINIPSYSWDISPDGERFLLLENPAQTKPVTQLVVITNFLDELNRRLPPVK